VWDSTSSLDSLALDLDHSTDYYWRMRSWNGEGGFSAWTEAWEFTTYGTLGITLAPSNPPVVVPVNGGSFDFTIALINNSSTPRSFDVWTVIQTPHMSFVPSIGPLMLTFPAGMSLVRARSQFVPTQAPAGTYMYRGFVANYPWVVTSSDAFAFTKLGSNFDAMDPTEGWLCNGELFPGEVLLSSVIVPTVFSVSGPTPNPFNPTTTINIALPEAAHMTMTVYDINGRQVAQVVDGFRSAGYHQVTFDGSHLASGIYLYSVTAGSHRATGKMVMLK
jgi:hypothetical protein